MIVFLIKERYTQKSFLRSFFLSIVLAIAITSQGLNNNLVFAAEPMNSITGTWNGIVAGEGPVEKTYKLNFFANISGAFSGDTSSGEWIGTFDSNYTVDPIFVKEKDKGSVKGKYLFTIDDTGKISGECKADVTGVLSGRLELQIQGAISESGELTGTWSGILNSQSLNYVSTPVSIDVKLDAAGKFKGKVKPIATPSSTKTISTELTSSTQPYSTPSQSQPINQYIMYAIVVIIIITGIYTLIRNYRRGYNSILMSAR